MSKYKTQACAVQCTKRLILQESGFLQRYHEAMRLQQEGQVDEARALYREILGSKVMDEVGSGYFTVS